MRVDQTMESVSIEGQQSANLPSNFHFGSTAESGAAPDFGDCLKHRHLACLCAVCHGWLQNHRVELSDRASIAS